MMRLASTLSVALACSVAFLGCGEDDKPAPKVDAGSVDASAADAGPLQCTGTFAQLTQTQLTAVTAAAMKKCAAPSDTALICTQNITTFAGACGIECLGKTGAEALTCISDCLKKRVPLSSDCASCYAETVACTQVNCKNECIADPAAAMCTSCQVAKGCRSAFFACSGLPGGAPATDAGAGADGATAGDGGAGADGATAGDGGGAADGGAGDAPATADGSAADAASTADTAAADMAAPAVDSATADATATD